MPEKPAPKLNVKLPEEPARAQSPWSVAEPVLKNPTLVEFHNKNAAMPEWRLQLQNAVRQRKARTDSPEVPEPIQSVGRGSLTTSGANALKAEESVTVSAEAAANPTLASALKRIERSRQAFLPEPIETDKKPRTIARPNKTHLYIAAKSNEILPNPHEAAAQASPPAETRAPEQLKFAAELPGQTRDIPVPKPAAFSTSFDHRPMLPFEARPETIEPKPHEIETETAETEDESTVTVADAGIEGGTTEAVEAAEYQEIDDCAPLAMRFNAGLFDLIIGSFASLLILSPLLAAGANWVSLTGAVSFLAVTAVVMFLYLTVAVGYYGRTFGMRLFSLEVVDIEGEEYPTVEQATISSLVYLAGFAVGGLGFLTILFNDEKRAAHDLLSRTIVVKEF